MSTDRPEALSPPVLDFFLERRHVNRVELLKVLLINLRELIHDFGRGRRFVLSVDEAELFAYFRPEPWPLLKENRRRV